MVIRVYRYILIPIEGRIVIVVSLYLGTVVKRIKLYNELIANAI